MVLKRLKLHQMKRTFRWSGTAFSPQTYICMYKYTLLVKNGLVLHHLATLFDKTNAVSKPEKSDQIVHGILPNIYEILPVSLPNDQ